MGKINYFILLLIAGILSLPVFLYMHLVKALAVIYLLDAYLVTLLHCPSMSLRHLLWAFLISTSPVVELRLALPLAIHDYEIPWYFAFPICFLGNLFPVPFLLLLLDPASRIASKVRLVKRIFDWIFEYTRRKGKLVEKYERIGIVILVAIPLPGSGAWTGSIVAFLLGLKFRSAFISIILGVFIAGVIVTILSLMGWAGGVIAGVVLIILAVLSLWRI